MRFKSIGTAAVAAGLGISLAACGSSSSSSASSGGSSSTAAAASDTVTAINNLTGVGTSVILDPGTAKALTSLGVSLAPFGSAKFDSGTSTITFPITSGYAEIHSDKSVKPGYILGSVQHDGSGMTLSAGATKLTLENFVVDPGNSMLYGTVGGKPGVPIAVLNGSNLQVGNSGGNVTLDGTKVELTSTAATAIDQTFHTTAVTPGLVLGTVHLVASGNATTYTDKTTDVSRLTGQTTSVTLNTQTLGALKSLGVSPGVFGTAKLDAATGSVSFPITGGFAAIHSDKGAKPGYIAGALIHQGSGLTLTAGSKTVTLTDFVVDPGDSMLTGTVGGEPGDPNTMVNVPLLFLDGSNLQVTTPSDGTVHLDGTVAELTSTAASALNAAFGTTALKAGIPLGVAHIIAAGTVSNG